MNTLVSFCNGLSNRPNIRSQNSQCLKQKPRFVSQWLAIFYSDNLSTITVSHHAEMISLGAVLVLYANQVSFLCLPLLVVSQMLATLLDVLRYLGFNFPLKLPSPVIHLLYQLAHIIRAILRHLFVFVVQFECSTGIFNRIMRHTLYVDGCWRNNTNQFSSGRWFAWFAWCDC